MKTGLLYDPVFLEHDTGAGHPESSARLRSSMKYLQQLPWFESLQHYRARPVARDWLDLIHDADYLQRAETTCASGAPYLDSMDVSICPDSFSIALQATGGVLHLADQIMARKIDNGMALVRPPGHHAEKNMALGFCLINNVAVLARYLQKHHGLDKVLILDWDVHHGNGTQHTFEEDPSVFYISTHQYPFYPGSGARSETGIGRGRGATLNCPMPVGADDADYQLVFREKVLPAIDTFKPEVLIISAGFDAHVDDPLAGINLNTESYAWMTERVIEKADNYCGNRVISVLEGGYDLNALPRCIEQHLGLLSGNL